MTFFEWKWRMFKLRYYTWQLERSLRRMVRLARQLQGIGGV